MRCMLTSLVVAATTALVPMLALAGNQEFAEQIAKSLRASGQMYDYKIGVMYQDGTAWLRGQVCSEEQAKTAMDIVSKMPGVSRVENKMTIGPPEAAPAGAAPSGSSIQFSRNTENMSTPQGRMAPPTGVLAPEQISRVSGGGMSGSRVVAGGAAGNTAMRLQETQAETPRSAARVATTFAPSPAQQVSAMELQGPQPTVAEQEMVPVQTVPAQQTGFPRHHRPMPMAQASAMPIQTAVAPGAPIPVSASCPIGAQAARHDQPRMPCYSWPSYASHPNYAAVTYPKQYSPTAWPYIGPFYPYPQVPLGWRKVTLEWDDGWWMLDFKD